VPSNLILGAISVLVGLVLILGSPRLARLPLRCVPWYVRHEVPPPKALFSQAGIRAQQVFWRVCGTLWLAGGVTLLSRLGAH